MLEQVGDFNDDASALGSTHDGDIGGGNTSPQQVLNLTGDLSGIYHTVCVLGSLLTDDHHSRFAQFLQYGKVLILSEIGADGGETLVFDNFAMQIKQVLSGWVNRGWESIR